MYRTVENGRLAWFHEEAQDTFWDDHWQKNWGHDLFREAESGNLGEYEETFCTYLPATGPILEAGCGTGVYVLALRQRGYDVEGVDNAAKTVQRVRELRPDLPVHPGDVTALPCPDGHYAGYISLGVAEHFREGPEAVLQEAWRVLAPGGIAIVTVPWYNALRRFKARLGLFHPAGSEGQRPFYQYAFHEQVMVETLERLGFRLLHLDGYSPLKGLRDELPFIKSVLRLPKLGPALHWRLVAYLQRNGTRAPFCHMLRLVVQKPPK
ncbi:MAG: class I SAM-dependent methyltransferase [Magnetococcales bacterium]|nr:class I SAM-dependent methyltransferase [Magnetococcales bacterium]